MKPTVLDVNDIVALIPKLDTKFGRKLVAFLLKILSMNKVNWLHEHNMDKQGAAFVDGLLSDLKIKLRIDNEEQLRNLPEGAFAVVSNHPFGALDGIIMIRLFAQYRPEFKVMVNQFLNNISAMQPNFIAVEPSENPNEKQRAVSMQGIRMALKHVRSGFPIGFFPAGAVSKMKLNMRFSDREWQENIMRLIQQLNIPVVPIYFHGHNSVWFNILGFISWKIRTLRLPGEVFRKSGSTIHVSIGDAIMPEELHKHATPKELGEYLKSKSYAMKNLA